MNWRGVGKCVLLGLFVFVLVCAQKVAKLSFLPKNVEVFVAVDCVDRSWPGQGRSSSKGWVFETNNPSASKTFTKHDASSTLIPIKRLIPICYMTVY